MCGPEYGRGYAQVTTGQSKESVIETMGQPSEVEACDRKVYFDGKFVGQCSETMVYHSFLEQ
jgi:hypothetical protein